MVINSSWNPGGELNIEQLQPNDTFRFACSNCCECCRDVKNAVMVEPLDLFRIAKHTWRSLEEASEQFTEASMLAWGYPILTLKTKSFMDTCIFLKNNRCSIHDSKPRACRLYPIIVGPNDSNNSLISLIDVKRNRNHARGQTYHAKDWLFVYLSEEDRRFIHADYRFAGEFAKLAKKIHKRQEEKVKTLMFLHRYFMFDTDLDFIGQFNRNMAVLKNELIQMAK